MSNNWRVVGVALMIAAGGLVACGSDSSGGTTPAGTAGSGTGGTSAGGAAGSGTGGTSAGGAAGSGTGGAAGSATSTTDCAAACVKLDAVTKELACPDDPMCKADCEKNPTMFPSKCYAAYDALVACLVKEPSTSFECDKMTGTGVSPKMTACATETTTLNTCLGGAMGSGGSNGMGM